MAPRDSATVSAGDSIVAPDGRVKGLADTEILIDGVAYEVADFVKKHPGGSIIKYQLGTDATDSFVAFHDRSPKVQKYLSTLKSRRLDANTTPDALVADFRELRDQLEKEGYFKPNVPHAIYRFSEIFLMHLVGFYLVFHGWWYTGLVVLGIVQGRCGWLMHEGGHYSITGNISVDRFAQIFLYGLGCGMSAAFWRNQHNKHHATPQKLRHDVDLDTLPLVAFNKLIAKRGNKFWLRFQAYCFAPIITFLVAIGWQFFLHPRHSLRTKNYLELLFMGLRYVLWTFLFWNYSVGTMIGAYMFYGAVGAAYIFTNFAVSHTHRPVLNEDEHTNWVLYSANYTTNCDPHFLTDWWMSYLNYQIEHHLFPSMPQFHFPELSPRVRALFEKHGVVYDSRPYFTAVRDTFKNLDTVGKGE